MDSTYRALAIEVIAYLRTQPEHSASFLRIQDHLSATVPVPSGERYPATPWIKDSVVIAVLADLIDHDVIDQVRESRGYVYALALKTQGVGRYRAVQKETPEPCIRTPD